MLPSSVVPAQDGKVVPSAPGNPYTLHVYEDLVQVPSLVLDVHGQNYPGLKTNDFTLRLDSGPPFHPRHTRLQGDDAVSFAFLIDDASGGDTALVDRFKRAVADLPPDLFEPTDSISVYAVDCHLVQSTAKAGTPAATLQAGVDSVLKASLLHSPTGPSHRCQRSVSLWDAIGAAIVRLRNSPGRRVLIVLSDGLANDGHRTWEELRLAASISSIAVFAMRPHFKPRFDDVLVGGRGLQSNREDKLLLLCAGTGGLALSQENNAVDQMLRHTINLIRTRYILEFPRAANGTQGVHALGVALSKRGLEARASGITVPMADKKLLDDPSTVPTDPSRAPTMGDRRIITPH